VPSVTLVWTAPGDDGNVGTASTYQLRYRTAPISGTDTLGWWNAATPVTPMPVPRIAGSTDSVVVGGLNWATTYYFIIKACDDGMPPARDANGNPLPPVPNCSGFSNVAIKAIGPAPDVTPPSRIVDLIIR